jgi:hypothetical protein
MTLGLPNTKQVFQTFNIDVWSGVIHKYEASEWKEKISMLLKIY